MKLLIRIDMDNEAFGEENAGCAAVEAARILKRLAKHLDGAALEDGWSQPLMDINGNRVGRAEVQA